MLTSVSTLFRAIVAVTLLLAATGFASANLSVKPAQITVELDTGRPKGQFVISNTGNTEARFRIKAMHYTYASDGGLRVIEPDEHSLAPWIKFNPREVVLPPKSHRVVRYVIVPRGKLRPGEYWAAMGLESLTPRVQRAKDGAGRTYNIKVVGGFLVPISGTVGNVSYHGRLQGVSTERTPDGRHAVFVDVTNDGAGILRLSGTYRLLDAAGETLAEGELVPGAVMPGTDRRFMSIVKEVPANAQRLRVEYGGSQMEAPLAGEIPVAPN